MYLKSLDLHNSYITIYVPVCSDSHVVLFILYEIQDA